MGRSETSGVPSSTQPNRWLLPAAAVLAAGLMAGGGVLTARALAGRPAASVLEQAPDAPRPAPEAELPPAKLGKKKPATFGLPAYPSAFDFHSMEVEKNVGSVSFSVKQGSSDAVVRHYIEKLGAAGWQFQWQRDTTMRPGRDGKGPLMSGKRVRWSDGAGRQLTLLVLDDAQKKGRAAQVALSWAPATGAAPKASSDY